MPRARTRRRWRLNSKCVQCGKDAGPRSVRYCERHRIAHNLASGRYVDKRLRTDPAYRERRCAYARALRAKKKARKINEK